MTDTKEIAVNRYLPEGGLWDSPVNTELTSTKAGLERAMREGRILEGLAVRCNCTDMTLTVRVGGMNGYIRREDALYTHGDEEIKDIAIITRVGRTVAFTVEGFFTDSDGACAVRLSRAKAQRRCYEEYVSRLTPGDIIPARVTHLESFGAFVDIGCGIVALMTVDTMSVSRISHPKERVTVGEDIYATVKSSEGGRIYMSLRELLGTWEENASLFSPSQTVTGVVRSVEEYGTFIELMPNLCGLAETREGVVSGTNCSVYIKNIIPERMKIKLIIIDSVTSPGKRTPIRYFADTEKLKHIDRWDYSPSGCAKKIYTEFQ